MKYRSFRNRVVAVASVMATVLACAERHVEPEGGATGVLIRDSLGIEIVEIEEVSLDELPLWTFSEDPIVSVGRVEGDAPYLFFRIFGAWRLGSDEIVVADGQSLEFRVFDLAGRFLRKYGGKGEGPGEFMGFPLTVSQSRDGRLAIYDYPLGRLTVLDPRSGDYTTQTLSRQCRDSDTMELRQCEISRVLANGTVFAYLRSPVPARRPGSGVMVQPGPSVRAGILDGETFSVFDSIKGATTVVVGYGSPDVFNGPALFQPVGVVAFGPDEMVVGDPDGYEIRNWSDAGTLRRVLRVFAPPEPVTVELLEQYRRWADTAPGLPAASREYLASVRAEGTVPNFGDLILDRAGRIWVQDYRPFWAFGPQLPRAWTIFGSDGVPLARIEGGAPGAILEAGEDYVLVRESGQFDVEHIRVYGIVRTDG